jgi:acid phosphatase
LNGNPALKPAHRNYNSSFIGLLVPQEGDVDRWIRQIIGRGTRFQRKQIRGSIPPLVLLLWVMSQLHCGGTAGAAGSSSSPSSTAPTPTAVQASPVVIVMEENQQYEDVIGNPAMPFFNSLAQQYALAANYYANGHNSLPNYFEITAGQFFAQDGFTGVFDADNIVRELVSTGRTWKFYGENLPANDPLGVGVLPYDKDHNPFAYFSDVVNSSVQQLNLVPFTQFAADLADASLPDYAFVVPNDYDDAHSCPAAADQCPLSAQLSSADTWLQNNIGPLLSDTQFQSNGLLVVAFDESIVSDTRNGGGHVAVILAGPHANLGFVSNTFYQHPSLLRLTASVLGVTNYPGAAASAPDMSEFLH